jgi:hypothetical protein
MKIEFIGDTHGKIDQLLRIVERTKADRILQLGDVGLGFTGVHLPAMKADFGFIRGNHDSPQHCRQHYNYAGEFGVWNGIFVVGGAYSVDWPSRTPGVTWWPDEELSPEQASDCISEYKRAHPRIVASHEAPRSIGEQVLAASGLRPEKFGSTHSSTAKLLQELWELHQPSHWIFGHYHSDWAECVNGTQFRCLDELSTFTVSIPHNRDG